MIYQKASNLLWLPIPRPAKAKAKAQASWKTLKAGQVLELTESWFDGRDQWQVGQKFTVAPEVTNQGVRLIAVDSHNPRAILWGREWKTSFKRVRARQKDSLNYRLVSLQEHS